MNNNTLVVTIIVATIIALIGFSGWGMGGYGYGMMSNYWGFGTMWIFGPIICILFIVLLVLVISLLIKKLKEKK